MTQSSSRPVLDATRYIKPQVERELWARAAGRCEFSGCNRILYKSPLTQERVNIAQKAHIYSFSPDGPRGWGPFKSRKALNEIENLMLMCHDCHVKIDTDAGHLRYPAELLLAWKHAHEERIRIVSGIATDKKTHVVCYGANIGEQASKLSSIVVASSLFPDWYPASENPTRLAMTWEGKDNNAAYWTTEERNLVDSYQRQIRLLLDATDTCHLSVFALAPMPLLVRLGALLTDKTPVEVYQLHREPEQTWKWMDAPKDNIFLVRPPTLYVHPPALVLSLSDTIAQDRVTAVLGSAVSIWEITIENPNNDFLKSRAQLSEYRQTIRRVLADIRRCHGTNAPLVVFPAMPVACALELGRARMPKADGAWTVFDYNNQAGAFVPAITIGPVQ